MRPSSIRRMNDAGGISKGLFYTVVAVAVVALAVGIYGVVKANQASSDVASANAVSQQEKAYTQQQLASLESKLRAEFLAAKKGIATSSKEAKGAANLVSKQDKVQNAKLQKLQNQVNTQYAAQQTENASLQKQITKINKLIKQIQKTIG